MKKFASLFLALALCMGLAVPAFAADGYEEVTIECSGIGQYMGRVTIDKAKPVTDQYGYVQYYQVPAQVQITVNLYENSLSDYLVAVGWYDVEPTEWGESYQDKDFTFLTPAGSLMEPKPRSEYRYEDGNANQLIPGQNYTFSLQTNLADAVYVDCGCRCD